MRSLAGTTVTALSGSHVVIAQLVLLGFSANGGTDVALNSSNMDLLWGGVTYRGAYGLGSVAPMKDAPGEIQGLQFQISGAAAAAISLALDGADQWQGAPVTIRTAVLDPASYAVLDAPVEWTGRGDTLSIQEDGQTCSIVATAESTAVDLLGGSALTYSDGDQQALYSGDLAFAYVVSQAGKPVIWPAREYFFK